MRKNLIILMLFACVSLPHASFAIPGFMKARMGTISGQVMHAGKPLPGVIVAFFDIKKGLPPIPGHKGRIPDQILLSDSAGKFSSKFLAGNYYVGALLRITEPKVGPPREGETFYFAQDGKGVLRKLAIQDFKKKDYGQINFVLPGIFTENEKSFLVEGTVFKGAKEKEPFSGAIVLAKTSKSQFKRPEYISARTGADGKFSLMLRPGPTFYLIARTSITGRRPQPGDNIGRYSHDKNTDGSSANTQGAAPPPGVAEDKPFRALNNEVLPVSGDDGQVVTGIKIHLYGMPLTGPAAQKPVQQALRRKAGIAKFTDGVAMKVLFASNSHKVDPQSFRELAGWAMFLKGDPRLRIELDGHTDNVGNAENNMKLSRERAQAVAQYLIDKGVDSHRIKVNGYGSTRPYVDNSTEARRHKNRRVDIKFIR